MGVSQSPSTIGRTSWPRRPQGTAAEKIHGERDILQKDRDRRWTTGRRPTRRRDSARPQRSPTPPSGCCPCGTKRLPLRVSRGCSELAGESPVTVMTKLPCSWWAVEGETRLSKPHDKVAFEGGEQACGPYDEKARASVVRLPARAGECGSRASGAKAKAKDGAKSWRSSTHGPAGVRGTERTHSPLWNVEIRLGPGITGPACQPGCSGKWRNL